MAHFAKIEQKVDPTGFTSETHNIVTEVFVVGNDIPTAAGPLGENDMHPDGEAWCQNRWGGTWKQTSYNNNFRKQYAGVNFRYDADNDRFIAMQPYASWTLDANGDWQPPTAYPSVTTFTNDAGVTGPLSAKWSEENTRWETEVLMSADNTVNRYWNPDSSTWIDF